MSLFSLLLTTFILLTFVCPFWTFYPSERDATLEQGDIVFKRSSRLAPNVPVVVEVVQCTYSHIVYDKWAADGYHETEYCPFSFLLLRSDLT